MINRIVSAVRRQKLKLRAGALDDLGRDGVSERFVVEAPSEQNAVDIFRDEWSSKLPELDLQAGQAELFTDVRLDWFSAVCGGFEGKSVLELGPLEGGHSYYLENHGAASVTAIEANVRAYLKCLIVKEIYDLQKVRFYLGDFVSYMQESTSTFDLCIASGVLYHMRNPVELLELISKRSGSVLIWTHYCIPGSTPHGEVVQTVHAGFPHKLYEHHYGSALGWQGFCGGSAATSYWMTRSGILSALEHFGFNRIETAFEQPDHVNGPAFAVAAFKVHN